MYSKRVRMSEHGIEHVKNFSSLIFFSFSAMSGTRNLVYFQYRDVVGKAFDNNDFQLTLG